MAKINPKDRIKHFSSNLITRLSLVVEDHECDDKVKSAINSLINMITLVTLEEDLFLGKKPVFFIQDVFIDEMIDISTSNADVNVELMGCDVQIRTDKYYFSKALKLFIDALANKVTFLKFDYDRKRGLLCITHDGNIAKIDNDLTKSSLIESLDTVNTDYESFSCHVASTILDMLGLEVKFAKRQISIVF